MDLLEESIIVQVLVHVVINEPSIGRQGSPAVSGADQPHALPVTLPPLPLLLLIVVVVLGIHTSDLNPFRRFQDSDQGLVEREHTEVLGGILNKKICLLKIGN